MTTYAFPTFTRALPYTEWKFGMEPNARVFTSPLSGQSQTIDLPGARWALNLRLAGLSESERGLMEGFLAQLRGRSHRFTAWDFINPRPAGTFRGTVTTVGTIAAGAVTCTINAASATQASKTLLPGDKLSIGGELKVVTAPASADAGGQINGLQVEPPFRTQKTAGSSVVWDKPSASFMLVESSWRLNYSAPRFADVAIDAIEVFS